MRKGSSKERLKVQRGQFWGSREEGKRRIRVREEGERRLVVG